MPQTLEPMLATQSSASKRALCLPLATSAASMTLNGLLGMCSTRASMLLFPVVLALKGRTA
ncbi:hypothetical protein FOMG_19516 [Fusarium oxysporum f. sp. melonis 26406]|uniref:Uncharacterized protein n=1 Tax=Fusarium oxysporum f. sp. melonis 26406 TaxID=1089452 RepID=W9Z626_FUSOX|nr:hypothetical protein FOMG_19516 [Fusarium oxysporum f. sp. melonis 26406]